jgi:PmbA protein
VAHSEIPGRFDEDHLRDCLRQVLKVAREGGASAASAALGSGRGLSVTVRLGSVETVESSRDRRLSVTVFFGHRKGTASTTDLRSRALRETAEAACGLARYSTEDPFAGLPDPARLAWQAPDLDLSHPWEVTAEHAAQIAERCEQAARAADPRIVNSEGATLSSYRGLHLYADSQGFVGSVPGTRHSLSCSVIAGADGSMQRDHWYSLARAKEDLESPASVGGRAAQRALGRLGARRVSTARLPVLFAPETAATLLGHLVGAIRGSALYRRASFLLDQLGERVFPPGVHIREQPLLPRAVGSAPFDGEGVATADHHVVRDGILKSYVLDSYAARRLGLASTGNAGGVHNLTVEPTEGDARDLIRIMGRGLLVTELLGMGVNTVTGDYSRGAAGYWVEDGEIQHPVEEFTVAGNLRTMFLDLRAVGPDLDTRGRLRTGSWLIGDMTVAGR